MLQDVPISVQITAVGMVTLHEDVRAFLGLSEAQLST
jgi:hypothetical protein